MGALIHWQQTIYGFLHKQNWPVSTAVNVSGLDVTSSIGYNKQNSNFFFYFSVAIDSGEIPTSVCEEEETLMSWKAAISKYIQHFFCFVVSWKNPVNLQHMWKKRGVMWTFCSSRSRTHLGQWCKAGPYLNFTLSYFTQTEEVYNLSKTTTDMGVFGSKA